jgi:hypothetical protein
MTNRDLRIATAEAEVDERRQRLIDRVDQLADMFEPRKIVHEVWESAKVKGADLAEDAVDAVRRRPVAAGGIVAALTMLIAREPIKDGIVSIYDAMTSKKKTKAKAKAAPPKPAAAPAAPKPAARRRTKKTTETKP